MRRLAPAGACPKHLFLKLFQPLPQGLIGFTLGGGGGGGGLALFSLKHIFKVISVISRTKVFGQRSCTYTFLSVAGFRHQLSLKSVDVTNHLLC